MGAVFSCQRVSTEKYQQKHISIPLPPTDEELNVLYRSLLEERGLSSDVISERIRLESSNEKWFFVFFNQQRGCKEKLAHEENEIWEPSNYVDQLRVLQYGGDGLLQLLQAISHNVATFSKAWVEEFINFGGIEALYLFLPDSSTKKVSLSKYNEALNVLMNVANYYIGIDHIVKFKGISFRVLLCIDMNNVVLKTRSLQLLGVMCYHSDIGYHEVLDSFTEFKTLKKEAYRFENIMHCLKTKNYDIGFKTNVFTFINILINSALCLEDRVMIRDEFIAHHIKEFIDEYSRPQYNSNYTYSKLVHLQTQIQVFETQYANDGIFALNNKIDSKDMQQIFSTLYTRTNKTDSFPLFLNTMQKLFLLPHGGQIGKQLWTIIEKKVGQISKEQLTQKKVNNAQDENKSHFLNQDDYHQLLSIRNNIIRSLNKVKHSKNLAMDSIQREEKIFSQDGLPDNMIKKSQCNIKTFTRGGNTLQNISYNEEGQRKKSRDNLTVTIPGNDDASIMMMKKNNGTHVQSSGQSNTQTTIQCNVQQINVQTNGQSSMQSREQTNGQSSMQSNGQSSHASLYSKTTPIPFTETSITQTPITQTITIEAPVTEKKEQKGIMVKDDVKYKKFFQLLKLGMPIELVKQKIIAEGFSVSLLDTPEAILKDEISSSNAPSGINASLLKNATLTRRNKDHPGMLSRRMKLSESPKNTSRNIYWDIIKEENVEGTVWDELRRDCQTLPLPKQNIDLDEEELITLKKEYTLSPNVTPKNPNMEDCFLSPNNKKSKLVYLLDRSRANNIAISIKRFRMEYMDIKNAIIKCDLQVLSVDKLHALIQSTPTLAEMDIIQSYQGDEELLNEAEKFLKIILPIKRLKQRLESLLMKQQFESLIADLWNRLHTLEGACREISNCTKFKYILKIVLDVGNSLNEGTPRADAIGFRINDLTKLSQVKNAEKTSTILESIAKVIRKKNVKLFSFNEEIQCVYKASLFESSDVKLDIDNIKKQLNNVFTEISIMKKPLAIQPQSTIKEKNSLPINTTITATTATTTATATATNINQMTNDLFLQLMDPFVESSNRCLLDLSLYYDKVYSQLCATMKHFGEDGTVNSSKGFFKSFVDFSEDLYKADRENERKRILEDKRRDKSLKLLQSQNAMRVKNNINSRNRGLVDDIKDFRKLKDDAPSSILKAYDHRRSLENDKLALQAGKQHTLGLLNNNKHGSPTKKELFTKNESPTKKDLSTKKGSPTRKGSLTKKESPIRLSSISHSLTNLFPKCSFHDRHLLQSGCDRENVPLESNCKHIQSGMTTAPV